MRSQSPSPVGAASPNTIADDMGNCMLLKQFIGESHLYLSYSICTFIIFRFAVLERHFNNPGLDPDYRCHALVKNTKRPPDFRFSNRHSLTQYLIVLGFLNAAVLLEFFPKNN